MPFDDAKYNRSALYGDLGYHIFSTQFCLDRLADAIELIAADSGVDVSQNLSSVREQIEEMKLEFDRFTGWKPK